MSRREFADRVDLYEEAIAENDALRAFAARFEEVGGDA
jgi:hypothetical protein